MTPQEFSRWTSDLSVRLPSLRSWLTENVDTLSLWRQEMFADLDIDDCLEVNRQLMAEGYKATPWEAERLAAEVRTRARNLAYQREADRRDRIAAREAGPVSRRGSMAEALAKALQSPDPAERRRIIDRELPAGNPEEGPRRRCLECQDTGLIKCYDPDTVIAAWRKLRGQIDHVKVYTVLAACTCSAGDRHANNQRRPVRRKDDRLFVCNEVSHEKQLRELAIIADTWEPPVSPAMQQEMPF